MKRLRDVFLTPLSDVEYMAISCDSCGGIGELPGDVVTVDCEVVGYYTTVVALSEMLAMGGTVMSIVDTLSVSYTGCGFKMLQGVEKAILEAGLSKEMMLTGSTEENIPVNQTAMGVTVIGKVRKSQLESYTTSVNDDIYLVGIPKMGQQLVEEEVIGQKGEIIKLKDIIELRSYEAVHEMIPIGSKGMGYELTQFVLPLESQLVRLKQSERLVDENASGGPSTAMLVSVKAGFQIAVQTRTGVPVFKIGTITKLNL